MLIYLAMLETEEERNSFGEYYEKHYGRCFTAARRITQNDVLAEEAVHNAFMRMIEHKEKYFTHERKKTASTIVLIVESESYNILKREKRFKHSDLGDVEPVIADGTPDAFRVVAGKEAVGRIKEHVSLLDDNYRMIYELKYICGMKESEIAIAIGMTQNAVSQRVHRLKTKLGKILREEGYTNE
jgi:RNA polymerase sigma-70 factor (ECF subfamily)